MDKAKNILFGIAFVALLGTITNYVYFSPLLTLFLPLAIFVVNSERLKWPVLWLYAFFLLYLLGTLFYDPKSLIDFGFYRRDGNFIISYSPLLVLPLFHFAQDLKKYFRYFYMFALSVYTLLFVVHLFTGAQSQYMDQQVFGGLFYAQNAVGGFLSVLGSLGFAYAWHRGNKKEWFFFGLILVMLVTTYSRGSILGLVLGIGAWWLVHRKYYKTLMLYMLVPVVLTVGSLMIGYPYYQQQINSSSYVQEDTGNATSSKNANIMLRLLYTFPRAYHAFKKSPIVGTGVGSFDDRPYQFEEVLPGVQYNAQPKKLHTDSHAHHSYLHILAEQGILGLSVFLIFWVSIMVYLIRIEGQPILRDYLLLAFFTISIASFTEHRITTPSMMLPFTISLGLFLAQEIKSTTYKIQKVD